VRLDRDRQGVLRVFQGPQLRPPVGLPHESVEDAAGSVRQGRADAAPPGASDVEPTAGVPAHAEPVESGAEPAGSGGEGPVTGEPEADATVPEAPPRRRRKAGTAAPRTTSTTARKPRARAVTPRRKKTTEIE
jgi:hypothetical protein